MNLFAIGYTFKMTLKENMSIMYDDETDPSCAIDIAVSDSLYDFHFQGLSLYRSMLYQIIEYIDQTLAGKINRDYHLQWVYAAHSQNRLGILIGKIMGRDIIIKSHYLDRRLLFAIQQHNCRRSSANTVKEKPSKRCSSLTMDILNQPAAIKTRSTFVTWVGTSC